MSSIFLTHCMVGPDFHSPSAPSTLKYTHLPMLKQTASAPTAGDSGKSQHFVYDKTIPAMWWKVFHSRELNHLIVLGIRHSPNLAAAKAALTQAQQNYFVQAGALFPSIAANFLVEPQRFNPALFGGSSSRPVGARITSIFTLYNPNLAIAYTLDIFGALRRQVESAAAQVDNQNYELEAAFLTLSSNIVNTAVNLASIRAQIATTSQLVRSQEKTLKIIKEQFNIGSASGLDVLLQQTELEQTRSALPPLKESLAQNYHALAILIGDLPSESDLPEFNLQDLHLPRELPIGCPSILVRQRPDIQAAEALLHSASAQVGVAIANMLPQFTINATYGGMSTVIGSVFEPQNIIWNVPMTLSQPIFNGGALLAKKRGADAAFQQAAAQYRQVVLQAFQNVADTLASIRYDAQLLQATKLAETAAFKAYQLSKQQYQLGGVHYLDLLIAERSWQTTTIARIQAEAARYTDSVALFQALGGGWQKRQSMQINPDLAQNTCEYRPV